MGLSGGNHQHDSSGFDQRPGHRRPVGDDALDAQGQDQLDVRRIIDRPHVTPVALPMDAPDIAWVLTHRVDVHSDDVDSARQRPVPA